MPGPGDPPITSSGPQFLPGGPTLRAGVAMGSNNSAIELSKQKDRYPGEDAVAGESLSISQDIVSWNRTNCNANGTAISRLRFAVGAEGGVNFLHAMVNDDAGGDGGSGPLPNPPTLIEGRLGTVAGLHYERSGGLQLGFEGTTGMTISQTVSPFCGGRVSIGTAFGPGFNSGSASLFVQVDRGMGGELKGNTLTSVGLAFKIK